MFFSYVMLFIHLDLFGVSLLSFGLMIHRDVCLPSNIIKLDSIPPEGLKYI